MKIAIVIPAYNEAAHIGKVIKQLKKYKLPIVVVDDGSKDNTYSIISRDKTVVVIKHKINLGKGAALKTGCDAAIRLGAQAIVIMDSDRQHNPDDLPKFIRSLESKKFQVVFGTRNFSTNIPLVRFLGNRFASVLINLLFGIYVNDLLCGYRAFTKKAYKSLYWQSSGYGVETEMVIKTGKYKLRYCEVPVETLYLDKFKGVTVIDAFSILINVFKWRVSI